MKHNEKRQRNQNSAFPFGRQRRRKENNALKINCKLSLFYINVSHITFAENMNSLLTPHILQLTKFYLSWVRGESHIYNYMMSTVSRVKKCSSLQNSDFMKRQI